MRRPTNDNRATLATTMARALVRKYPAPWRARYEREVLDLLDDARVRTTDVIDVARGLVTERVFSLFEPGDHPAATSLTFSLLPLLLIAGVWLVAVTAGREFRELVGPLPQPWPRIADLAPAAVWFWVVTRFWPAMLRQNGDGLSWRAGLSRFPLVSPWWLVAAFLLTLVEQWAMPSRGRGFFLF